MMCACVRVIRSTWVYALGPTVGNGRCQTNSPDDLFRIRVGKLGTYVSARACVSNHSATFLHVHRSHLAVRAYGDCFDWLLSKFSPVCLPCHPLICTAAHSLSQVESCLLLMAWLLLAHEARGCYSCSHARSTRMMRVEFKRLLEV